MAVSRALSLCCLLLAACCRCRCSTTVTARTTMVREGEKVATCVTVPSRLCQMFDVLANFGGIKGCNDPTFCGPDQAAQHKDAYSGNSYAFIQSGHYRQILCGAHGVPGGMFGNCQIKKARDE